MISFNFSSGSLNSAFFYSLCLGLIPIPISLNSLSFSLGTLLVSESSNWRVMVSYFFLPLSSFFGERVHGYGSYGFLGESG